MAFFLHAARRKETGISNPDFTPPVFPEEPLKTKVKPRKKELNFDTEFLNGDNSSNDLMDQMSKLTAALNTSSTETFSLNLEAAPKPKRKFATRGQTTSDTTPAALSSQEKTIKKDPLKTLSRTVVGPK